MIKKISLFQLYSIRNSVLGEGIPNYSFQYLGDDAESTFHLGFLENEEVIGILTVMKINDNVFQFRGMAVDQRFQNKKIGSQLLDYAEKLVAKPNTKIWLNARLNAVIFYEKSGYVKNGEFFNIEPIGLHIKMEKHF